MHRLPYFVLLQLCLCVHCYTLHPKYSANQTPVNENIQTLKPLQNQAWPSSIDGNNEEYVRGLSENREERHVDAIFTNTYRKFLGQISARRYLQNMIGKSLGQDTQKKAEDSEDSLLSDRTLGDELMSILSDGEIPDWRAEEYHGHQI